MTEVSNVSQSSQDKNQMQHCSFTLRSSRESMMAARALLSSPLVAMIYLLLSIWSCSKFVLKSSKAVICDRFNAEFARDWAASSCWSCQTPFPSKTKDRRRKSKFSVQARQWERISVSKLLGAWMSKKFWRVKAFKDSSCAKFKPYELWIWSCSYGLVGCGVEFGMSWLYQSSAVCSAVGN